MGETLKPPASEKSPVSVLKKFYTSLRLPLRLEGITPDSDSSLLTKRNLFFGYTLLHCSTKESHEIASVLQLALLASLDNPFLKEREDFRDLILARIETERKSGNPLPELESLTGKKHSPEKRMKRLDLLESRLCFSV